MNMLTESQFMSGGGTAMLLSVPKLRDGTGKTIAYAVKQATDNWKLADHIKAACCDATASNTGKKSGSCNLLAKRLKQSLLYMSCRHHIFEIMNGNAFDLSLGYSTGPDIQLFVRFKKYWSHIDVSQFESGFDDYETSYILSECQNTVDQIVRFAKTALNTHLRRGDYREFLELVLMFLGEKLDRGLRFIQPGAYHRARMMAKIIYSLKIWMFRQQFTITPREIKGLRDLNIFVALVYTKF